MRLVVFAGLAAALIVPSATRGDSLIYQLPPDGTAALFETDTVFTVDGQERNVKGTLSVSSVGEVVVDNEKCRWIEVKSLTMAGGAEQITVVKCLIPEQHLVKGASPGEHVLRGWLKSGDAEPQEIKDVNFPQARRLAGFLSGPGKNLTDLEKKEIDGALGKLECAGVTGDVEFQRDNGTTTMHYENRLHEKAPFGLVSAVWKFEITANGQNRGSRTTRLTLTAVNPTALSDLPDKK